MKKQIFIHQLNREIEFDFMMMKLEKDFEYIDNELRVTYLLTPITGTIYNLVLGIHFDITTSFDERFDNYSFISLEKLYKIELYDFNLTIELTYQEKAKLLQIATSMFPREYKEIVTNKIV